jgi:hypothetical protein
MIIINLGIGINYYLRGLIMARSLTKNMVLTKLLARRAPGATAIRRRKRLKRSRFNKDGHEPLLPPVKGAYNPNMKGGPGAESLYDKKYHPRLLYRLALLGHTDKEMCVVIDIPHSTLKYWLTIHPETKLAIGKGREQADAKVAQALYRSAIGWGHLEEEIVTRKIKTTDQNGVVTEDLKILRIPVRKKYPPNVQAAEFWLKNRQKKNWTTSEARENAPPVNVTFNLGALTTEELRIAQKLGQGKIVKQIESGVIEAEATDVTDEN